MTVRAPPLQMGSLSADATGVRSESDPIVLGAGFPGLKSRSGQRAGAPWVCPGCLQDRESDDLYVLGPDPTSSFGPLLWDVDCLRYFRWRAG